MLAMFHFMYLSDYQLEESQGACLTSSYLLIRRKEIRWNFSYIVALSIQDFCLSSILI